MSAKPCPAASIAAWKRRFAIYLSAAEVDDPARSSTTSRYGGRIPRHGDPWRELSPFPICTQSLSRVELPVIHQAPGMKPAKR
jgi:hypothetical protein